MPSTRNKSNKSQGFSLVELMISFAVLGVGVAVFANMRSQNFKSVVVLKNRQEATRIGHYLLTFTDCARTKAAAGYAAACGSNGSLKLLAADGSEILPATGKLFDRLQVGATCDEGIINVSATGPDWSTTPKALLDGVPIVCKDLVVPCLVNPAYNPSQIDCTINVKNKNSIWKKNAGWVGRVNGFTDSLASFISPLATASKKGWGTYCPEVPGSEKLLYTTYLDVKDAGDYKVESIIDDSGSVRFWENGDPSKEIIVGGNQLAPATINLRKKKYVIVIDATDHGKAATGAAFSIRNPSGTVVKRSEKNSNNETCIFRVSKSEDIATFVPKAASCRQCYGNLAPP
jgi:prepilin-type N-terminal cleavage/methylation domain-containing protein